MVKTNDPERNEARIAPGRLLEWRPLGQQFVAATRKETGAAGPGSRLGVWRYIPTGKDFGLTVVTGEIGGYCPSNSVPSNSPLWGQGNNALLPGVPTGGLLSGHPKSDPVPTTEGKGGSLKEPDRQALLRRAVQEGHSANDPIRAREQEARQHAVELLGGEAGLGLAIRSEEDLLRALTLGFPAQVLRALQDAGYPHSVLEQVIAPRRTLMRRRGEGQRLTRAESDAAWRLAYVLAFGSMVLNGSKAAIDWLMRAKPAFNDQKPLDLLETSVGTAAVERLLRQLDWGDVA